MAAPLLVVAAGMATRPQVARTTPRAKIAIEPSAANQVQRKAASPDETSRDLYGEPSAIETK